MTRPPRCDRGRKFEYGRWYPSPEVREIVRPLAQMWAGIRSGISDLSDYELDKLIEAVDAGDFGGDNCWWAEYEVLQAFGGRARIEKADRERKRQEAKAE